MAQAFGALSSTDEVLAGADLRGKRAIVTGTSSGLGVETARALAARGAHVIGTARDIAKAKAATAGVIAAATEGGGVFELMEMDLASFASVRTASDALKRAAQPIDIVIANAGVMAAPFELTEDGFETQLATNHLGHFLFINRIAPLLRDGARVVELASSAHRIGPPDLEDPNFERTPYHPFLAYGRSKSANILFAVEFDRRNKARGVRAAAVHPGAIQTELVRYLGADTLDKMVEEMSAGLAAQGKGPFAWKTLPQGAATSVWAAVTAPADTIGGQYCENCHVGRIAPEDQQITAVSEGVRAFALDPDRANDLWAKSETWVGERF
ncbi:MAG TPA: SDR family NAD(P)-dependent oxidoreductase [Caulobacteraceae bacterium]|nr:SDR family NAD(P)-dependent oxidoreductase [Caulobacteraceae bacterium]